MAENLANKVKEGRATTTEGAGVQLTTYGTAIVAVLLLSAVFLLADHRKRCPSIDSPRERDSFEALSSSNDCYLSPSEFVLFQRCARSGSKVALDELIRYYENYEHDPVSARYWREMKSRGDLHLNR
jgi:hypothetical protein